jgi:hypothetical protein
MKCIGMAADPVTSVVPVMANQLHQTSVQVVAAMNRLAEGDTARRQLQQQELAQQRELQAELTDLRRQEIETNATLRRDELAFQREREANESEHRRLVARTAVETVNVVKENVHWVKIVAICVSAACALYVVQVLIAILTAVVRGVFNIVCQPIVLGYMGILAAFCLARAVWFTCACDCVAWKHCDVCREKFKELCAYSFWTAIVICVASWGFDLAFFSTALAVAIATFVTVAAFDPTNG